MDPSCERCGYCGVFAEAPTPLKNTEPDILVVGDIPKAKECMQGEVMTGPGANILRQALEQIGLAKARVQYVTACQCAVPKAKNVTIKRDILNCHARLLNIVCAVKPKRILLLGKTSYEIFMNEWKVKISDLYGRMVINEELQAALGYHPETMIVFNPGAILRAPQDYKQFIVQLSNFKKMTFDNDVYDPGVPQWTVIDTEEQVDAFLKWCSQGDGSALKEGHLWGCDIEATDVDYRYAQPTVLGLSYQKNITFVFCREVLHRWGEVLEIFTQRKWQLALQNGKYDKKVLWRRGTANIRIAQDTQYQAYVLDEQCKRDLGTLTKLYINVESYKFKMNQNFKAISVENYKEWKSSLIERVAFDADYTRQLSIELAKRIDEPGNESLRVVYDNLIMPAANFLARVEQNGMLIDADFLHKLDIQYIAKTEECLQEIERLAKYDWDPDRYMIDMDAKTAPAVFNPGSPKQMSWMVFKRLKLKPTHREGQGTAEAVLASIPDPPDLIQKVLEYRGIKKEHSTYVLGLLKRRDTDGKVRATFKPDGTATGRLSCVEPNLQNQPSTNGVGNIRRSFVAPKGYVYAEIDYSGAELRWLAILSGDKNLTEVFASGRNLHDETARLIAGDNFTKKDRMGAKCINFGIVYGIEAPSVAEKTGFTLAEAHAAMNAWATAYPQAWEYLAWCKRMVDTGQYIQTPFGNRRRFGLVSPATRSALHNEARNAAIQCSSSHTLVCVGIQEEEWLREHGVQIVNLVHDSVLLAIPAEGNLVQEVCLKFAGAMQVMPKQLFGTDVRFDVDVDMGLNWGELGEYNRDTGNWSHTWDVTGKPVLEERIKTTYKDLCQFGQYDDKGKTHHTIKVETDFDTWYSYAAPVAELEIYSRPWYVECQNNDVPPTSEIV